MRLNIRRTHHRIAVAYTTDGTIQALLRNLTQMTAYCQNKNRRWSLCKSPPIGCTACEYHKDQGRLHAYERVVARMTSCSASRHKVAHGWCERAKLNAAQEAPQGALSSKRYKHSTLTLKRQIKRF